MRKRIALILIALFTMTANTAVAQDASRSTYLKLLEVQKLWEATDYSAALSELESYVPKTSGNAVDAAIINQYIAHTHVFMDDMDKARDALEVALAIPGLETDRSAELNLMYGQIVLGDEEYEKARAALEFWFNNTEQQKQPSQLFSLGYANFMTDNLPRAETILARAIDESTEPNDSWYRLYYQSLFDQKKYGPAEDVILGMLNRNPQESDYWRILANHYLQLEDSKKALSAIAIAYNEGFLKDAPDLKRMIALYGFVEIPEKAARLLQAHIDDKTIEADAESIKRLGDLWMLARERDNAKTYLEQAADLAPDGKTFEMLGNIFFEDEDWSRAYDSYMKAIDAGGIDDVERIYLLAGISADRDGNLDLARSAFVRARESEDLRGQANALLQRLGRN